MDYMYLLMLLIPMAAQIYISVTYGKYKKIKNSYDMTGYDVARKILDDNGLNDVYVVETSGTLSDHYDPRRKTVRLSNEVYNGSSVASMAIAAHECGHAIQDAQSYAPLKIRGAIVPVVNFGATISWPLILIGIVLGGSHTLIMLGVLLFSLTVIFQLVTLPVEFNASSRALKILGNSHILYDDEISGARKVLTAAALTYVAAAASSILQLLRLLLLFGGRRDD